MRKVETALSQNPTRHARHVYLCVSLVWPDGHAESFEGQVGGTLVWPMRGENGFGYDQFFAAWRPHIWGDDPQAKHAISHRADAFAQLVAGCFGG